ncbi:hypothetical protein [Tabrizicola sp.]|uniref:hypothetical protein n=1 Tax=Tabrizicola sp. TaxID=2005166 RepID=UPI002FDC9A0E
MFQRYYQTIARIAAGTSSLLMLAWFLWPRNTPLQEREEAFFAFVIAVVFWLLTEFKESDEVIYRAATKNDIRLAREIASYSADKFKTMLLDHDYHNAISPQYLTEMGMLISEHDSGVAFFQDRRVQPMFVDFCFSLDRFARFMAEHSSPNRFGKNSIIPEHIASYGELPHHVHKEISEANLLASAAWRMLLPLIKVIKDRIPEAFDDPIEYRWFRSESIYRDRKTR